MERHWLFCSGCDLSLSRNELTLTAIKRSLTIVNRGERERDLSAVHRLKATLTAVSAALVTTDSRLEPSHSLSVRGVEL